MFNVITVMGRPEYYEELFKIFKPKNVKWYIVTDPNSSLQVDPNENWIQHLVCDIVISEAGFQHNDYPDHDPRFQKRWIDFYRTLNWAFDQLEIQDDEYYSIINDDDAVEPEFYEKIKNVLPIVKQEHSFTPDIILTSMQRGTGEFRWVGRHPTSQIVVTPESVVPGGIGLEQMQIRGELLRDRANRFPVLNERESVEKYSNFGIPIFGSDVSDGMFITYMARKYKEKVILLPEINVWFNYFEPGRW